MANDYQNLPPELSSIYDREMRRRKINEMLMQQAIEPHQTQMVSGRAVPYGIGQGLTQIAKALLAKRGMDASDKALQDVGQRYQQGQQAAVQDVMRTMQGAPQTGGPLRGVQDYQQFQPEVKPDLEAAAMKAVTDPYLSRNQGAQSVLSAMLRQKNMGSTSRSRPIPTSTGYWEETDKGWAPMLDKDGNPILPVPSDVDLARNKKTAEIMGKDIAEKTIDKPKREMEIEAQTEKTENLDELIDIALKQSEGFTSTGFLGQLTSGIGSTPAHDLKNTLNTIKANVGFDKLQQMRDSSPTGGALGQVSERENELLQQVWSSVEQSQTEVQLKQNLERVRKQVKESWKRIADAYEKDYGVPYGSDVGQEKPKKRLKYNRNTGMME